MGVLKVNVGGAWVDAFGGGIAMPRGYVTHVVAPATTSIVATVIDMVGASVTWTADPTRRYKTTLLTARLDQAAAGGNIWVQLTDAANVLKGSESQSITLTNGGYGHMSIIAVESGLSGTQVRKARIRTDAGSLTAQAGTLVLVEDIGGV